MEAKLSPLELVDFVILNSSFKFNNVEENTEVSAISASYTVDIDFAIVFENNYNKVFVKVFVNKEERQGYSIFAEGMAVFTLSDKENIDEEQKSNLQQYSAVSISLNSLRGFIINMTGSCPLGKYILPSIDVTALFKQKIESLKKVKKKVSKK